jgi:hypothetical protein
MARNEKAVRICVCSWNGSRADPIWMCGIWDTNKSEKVEHRVIYPRRGNGLAGSGAKRVSYGETQKRSITHRTSLRKYGPCFEIAGPAIVAKF